MPRAIPGLDPYELQISRQFTQYVRALKNVHFTTVMHGKLRKKSADWALEPIFVGHNADFPIWMRELPDDMQIHYPSDGSAPWIPSHFIANMHSYHHLGIIMHLRPQIHAISDPYDGMWKQHMLTCYSAAKHLCKLQEAVLKTYGLPGLLCMIRGISFTIYAILTCTMLHLVSSICLMLSFNLNVVGCHHLSRSRFKQRCARVLCPPHAHLGRVRAVLANAGDAAASGQPSAGVLCGCEQTLRAQANVSVW